MAIEFLLEEKGDTELESSLKNLQYFYFFILLYFYVSGKKFKDIRVDTPLGFKAFQCSSTFYLLERIMGIKNFNERDSDAVFWEVSFYGYKFPDHIFGIIETGEVFYILQSFFFVYPLNSQYGIIKLTGEDKQDFLDLLENYKMYQSLWDRKLKFDPVFINANFEKYTGVFGNRHVHLQESMRINADPVLSIKKTRTSIQHIINSISSFVLSLPIEDEMFIDKTRPVHNYTMCIASMNPYNNYFLPFSKDMSTNTEESDELIEYYSRMATIANYDELEIVELELGKFKNILTQSQIEH